MEDDKIIELYRNGDEREAFNRIVRKYSEQLYWHIRKMVIIHDDADDILQNTLLKAWQGLPTFREDAKLFTWLYRIATNESITFLKKKKITAALSLSDYESRLSASIASDSSFNGDKLQMALHQAIAKLPPKQKAVFTLRYFEEMKYEEMSEIFDTSVGALKASYHAAYKKVLENVKRTMDI